MEVWTGLPLHRAELGQKLLEEPMPKEFHTTIGQRIFNTVLISLTRAGLALGPFSILTVRGRKTGKPYSLPVTPIELNGKRWLVSPYGEVSWVRNTRAAGVVTLTHGRTRQTVTIIGQAPTESAPILKAYLKRFPYVQRGGYFEATPDSPLEAFAAEARYHPVFQLSEQ
jgi:deazaflavin-dependent oxidoreductase (nitroreductase family)